MATPTYEEMQAKVADWLGIDLTTATDRLKPAVRGDVINMIIADLCRAKRLRFCQKTTTISLQVGVSDYNLPADWIAPHTFQYFPAGSPAKFLDVLTSTEFDVRFPDSGIETNGKPSAATIWGTQLIVKPKPDDTYSLKTRYYYILDPLTEGSPGNTNIFLQQAWDVVLFGCLSKGSMYGVEDNRIGVFKDTFEELKRGLVIDTGSNRRTGGLPVTSQEPG